MKKIQSLLLALPLVVAAALVSCSDDNIDTPDPQPGTQNTVTFKATMPETRVAYNVNGNNDIKCTWDSNDLGKIVKFERTVDYTIYNAPYYDANGNISGYKDVEKHGTITYDFIIESIDGGVATLAYTDNATYPSDYLGDIKDPNATEIEYEAPNKFPDLFTGIATYTTDAVQSQPNATSTSHLNKGTILITEQLTNKTAGSYIQFKHATSVYRVTFNAPATIPATANPTLSIETAEGVFGEVKIGFGMTQGSEYTVYLHGEQEGMTSKLTFRLDYEKDANHIVVYAYKDLPANTTLYNGKYYSANLIGKNPESKEIEKTLYEALGNAPIDVQYSNKGIPLDENYNLVEVADGRKPSDYPEIAYYLYLAKDVLRDDNGKILYFYWGETEGHTRDENGYENINTAIEPNFKYGYYVYSDKYDYHNKVASKDDRNLANAAQSLFMTNEFRFLSRMQNLKYVTLKEYKHTGYTGGDDFHFHWILNSNEEVAHPAAKGLKEELGDAASKKWGGKWRMMGFSEARAFLKSLVGNQNGMYSDTQNKYKFQGFIDNNRYEDEIDFPKTGYCCKNNQPLSGFPDDRDGQCSGVDTYYSSYDNFFWTWLRTSFSQQSRNVVPYKDSNNGNGIDNELDLITNVYSHLFYSRYIATIEYAHTFVPAFTTEASFIKTYYSSYIRHVYYGLPILPVLVVPKNSVVAPSSAPRR